MNFRDTICISSNVFLSSLLWRLLPTHCRCWNLNVKLRCHKVKETWIFTTQFVFLSSLLWRQCRCWDPQLIAQRHTTLDRNPLEEGSAHSRNLCLTTNDIHKRQDIHARREIRTRIPKMRASGQGFLSEASRSLSETPNAVGPLWMSDQPDAETVESSWNVMAHDDAREE
jgi:hypothetical protein